MAFGVVCVHLGECLNRRESNFSSFFTFDVFYLFFWCSYFFWFEHLYITLEFGISCCNVFFACNFKLTSMFYLFVFVSGLFRKEKKKSLWRKGHRKECKMFLVFFQWKVREKKELESVKQKKVDCFKINFFVCATTLLANFYYTFKSPFTDYFLGCKQIFLL